MTTTPTVTLVPILFRGDDVTINHPNHVGQVWTVHEPKKATAVIRPQGEPDKTGLDCPLELLVKTGTRSTLPEVVGPDDFTVGEVVRITRDFGGYTPETLLVVTKINPTTLGLDPLGGGGGTSIRSPFGGVVKVALADILA